MQVKIELTEGGRIPSCESEESAGYDCYANIKTIKDQDGLYIGKDLAVQVQPGATVLIPLGFKCEFGRRWWMDLRARSGKSLNTKLRIANGAGVIDSNYRKEVCAILDNTGSTPIRIMHGEKIAQFIMRERFPVTIKPGKVKETDRGGFGSTGN